MIRFKSGVRLDLLCPQMVLAASVVDAVYAKHDVIDCVITSGSDGVHSPGSYNGKGGALDFRTRNVPTTLRNAVAQEIGVSLGDNFDVVLERDHLHVEYDPPAIATDNTLEV